MGIQHSFQQANPIFNYFIHYYCYIKGLKRGSLFVIGWMVPLTASAAVLIPNEVSLFDNNNYQDIVGLLFMVNDK